jgi:hypothetical protein
MILVLININDHMLHVLLEKLFDLISRLRIVALGRLNCYLQMLLVE